MAYAEFKRAIRMNVLRPMRRGRTLLAWKRWSFQGVPILFANSMPKSGSHLLFQLMEGFCQIGPFVETGGGPIRTITIKGRLRSQDEILADLRRLRSGDFGWGYLRATEENFHLLCQPGWVNYFIIRDPRDMLVSHVFYATDMYEGHGMHKYYQSISFDERLKTAIQGIDREDLHLSNVRARYDRIEGWFSRPEVMTLHFEDLILERERWVHAMLDRLESSGYRLTIDRSEALRRVIEAVNPAKSSTFRKGKVGGWREHFTEEHKQLFKDVAGDLLICLGYEKNNDW